MGQNVSSLEYGNCRDPCANADAVFCKSQFREFFFSPWKNLRFLYQQGIRSCYNTLLFIFRSIICRGHLREVKHKRKFQTSSSKSGRGRLQEVPSIVI